MPASFRLRLVSSFSLISLAAGVAVVPQSAASTHLRLDQPESSPAVQIAVLGDASLLPPTLRTRAIRAAGVSSSDAETRPELGAVILDVPAENSEEVLQRLEDTNGVRIAYVPGRSYSDGVTPNDPLFIDQIGFQQARVPDLWSRSTGTGSTRVAIVDSGVSPHPELNGRLINGYDFANGDANAADDVGHGTKAALVALAAGNDGLGSAGACWNCEILAVKVLGADGSGGNREIADGIVYAAKNGADVINLSLGSEESDPLLAAAVSFALAQGIPVVSSAGNNGLTPPGASQTKHYPAAYPGVISVAGVTNTGALSPWTTRGTWVTLAASGCNTVGYLGPAYEFCGTSSAAPLVSGVVGVLKSIRPNASNAAVRAALTATAISVSPNLESGRIDAFAASDHILTDTVAPEIQVAAPPGYLADQVVVHTHSQDEFGVSRVELFLDGAAVGSSGPDAAGNADFGVSLAGQSDGQHTLVATAYDPAGHATSASTTIVVDQVNPVVTILSPATGSKQTGTFTATLIAEDPNGIMGTFLVLNGKLLTGWPGAGVRTATVPVSRSTKMTLVAITVDQAGRISGSNFVNLTAKRRR